MVLYFDEKRRHDTQYNVTEHNDTEHNDTQYNVNEPSDTQHNDTQHNDTQHNDTEHYDTEHNDTQHSPRLGIADAYKIVFLNLKMNLQINVSKTERVDKNQFGLN